jgi:hypothetical protein
VKNDKIILAPLRRYLFQPINNRKEKILAGIKLIDPEINEIVIVKDPRGD